MVSRARLSAAALIAGVIAVTVVAVGPGCVPAPLPPDVEGPDPDVDEGVEPLPPSSGEEHEQPPPPVEEEVPPVEEEVPPVEEEVPPAEEVPIQQTCPRVRITTATLNVRADPSTSNAAIGQVRQGQILDVLDLVEGESVGVVTAWFEIASSALTGFVTSAYAECTFDEAPAAPDGYLLPLVCGSTVRIAQGNFGSFSHTGRSRYAYDFSIASGTPMLAMADGEVVQLFEQTGPGDPCYSGGGSDCFPFANYVALRHGDGTQSIYKHLNRVDVSLGQLVPRGTQLGLSGSTGYSTGPHAHVMRQEDCGNALQCESVPLLFADVGDDGEPEQDDNVTSGNCP